MAPPIRTKASRKMGKAPPQPSQDLFESQAASSYGPPYSPLDSSMEGLPATPGVDVPTTSIDLVLSSPTKVQVSQRPVEEEVEGDVQSEERQEEEEDEQQQKDPSEPLDLQQQQQRHQRDPEDETEGSHLGSRSEESEFEVGVPAKLRRDSLNFTRRTEAALVEWLQENTWLYDKNQAMYRDRDRKDRAFEEKGRMLNPKVSGGDLKRWLASRRTQFGRITKKIGASGSGAPNLTEREKFVLKYFEFLRKHIIRHRDPPSLASLR